MEHRLINLALELRVADDALTGRVTTSDGTDTDFSGWLGLVATIEALLADAATQRGGRGMNAAAGPPRRPRARARRRRRTRSPPSRAARAACSPSSARPASARARCWPALQERAATRACSSSTAAPPSTSATSRSGSSSTRSTTTSPRCTRRRIESVGADLAAALPRRRRHRPAPAAPRRRRALPLHRALRSLLEMLARERPVALILDDLHWADDASIELVLHLLRRPRARPPPARVRAPPDGARAALLHATRAAAGAS